MLDDITELYKKQFDYYKEIHEILLKFEAEEFNMSECEISLQNIDFLMQKISKLNDKCEQQKQIYITKNRLKDFIGEEIIKVESDAEYAKFKTLTQDLGKEILSVKKLQDVIVSKMQDEINSAWKLLKQFNNQGKITKNYEKVEKMEEKNHIDIKK